MSLTTRTLDLLAALTVKTASPVLKRVAKDPTRFPRYRAQADRTGVHFRSTHYYQPVYTADDLPEDVTGERPLPGLDLDEAGQLALLDRFAFRDELATFGQVAAPDRQTFGHDNISYQYADAESLYSMLRLLKPRRIVEIGSGYSTVIARAAVQRNDAEPGAHRCEHVCVEPYEMPWLEGLGVRVVRQRVQDVDPALFRQLSAGDVLFVDSSHVIRPYGDVLKEYQEIIPALSKGVFVHAHDIFTPRDYPEAWLRVQRRLWNEQYLMEAMLAHSSRYRVTLALNWLKHHHFDALARVFPATAAHPDHEPGAFWFEVVE